MSRSYNRLAAPAAGRGFTLIEIVVAMTILAVALGALLQIFGTGLRGISVASDRVAAVLLAKSKLAEVGPVLPLDAATSSGNFADRFQWRIDAAPVELGSQPQPADIAAYSMFAVKVTVEWDRDRRLMLSTLRLGSHP